MAYDIANEEAGREVGQEYSHDELVFYQVYLEGFPSPAYTDTLDGVIETLKHLGQELKEGFENDAYVFKPVLLTKEQFDNLPEFTGF